MKLTCTVSRMSNGKWVARHTGSSTGQVEVTAPTRAKALAKMRDELHCGLDYCPGTGFTDDFVELQVQEEGGRA